MDVIHVNNRPNGLIVINCDCKFTHTTNIRSEANRKIDAHLRTHKASKTEAGVVYYLDGVRQEPKPVGNITPNRQKFSFAAFMENEEHQ